MQKEEFLKTLAEKGYDVGFGAKKNFASFDMINKLPSWVGFISLAIGIIQISYNKISIDKELSILLIFVGIAIMYLEVFKSKVEDFEKEGIRLTKLFNSIRVLYYQTKSDNEYTYVKYSNQYETILNDFYSKSISKQVFMSQWLAHFKFFYEMQTEWIEKELKLEFFKDKIPNSLKMTFFLIIVLVFIYVFYGCIPSLQGFCQ